MIAAAPILALASSAPGSSSNTASTAEASKTQLFSFGLMPPLRNQFVGQRDSFWNKLANNPLRLFDGCRAAGLPGFGRRCWFFSRLTLSMPPRITEPFAIHGR